MERFVSEFEHKYGNLHPAFFHGSYSQALDRGKSDITFVLAYIHSPTHKNTDKFCTEVICTQEFVDFVQRENIIFWACSSNYPEGFRVFQALKGSTFPLLSLHGLRNHRMFLIKKIEGFYNVIPLIGILQGAMSNYEFAMVAARSERQERQMAHLLRQQQDEAFQESLRADQEKEKKKREEQQKILDEKKKVEEEAEQLVRKKEKIQEMKTTLLGQLPAEPQPPEEDVIKISFQLPNGKRLDRLFLKSHLIKHLYYFVFCNDQDLVNFKIRTNFPVRDLPGRSPNDESDFGEDEEMCLAIETCDFDRKMKLFVQDLDS